MRKALRSGSRRAIRSRHAPTSSCEEISPAAISSAWRARPAKTGSSAPVTAAEATGARARGAEPLRGGGGGAWHDRPLPVTTAPTTAEGLCRFEGRGPCTDAERRAAGWLHDELRAAGHEAWVETHWVRPQWALALALHATIGVVASLAAPAAPLPAAIAAGLAALSMALEAAGRTSPLRWLFPRRATQNVLTVPDEGTGAAPPASSAPTVARGAAPVALLICARYDAPRGGLITRDGPRRLGARLRRRLGGHAPGPRAGGAPALAGVAARAALRQLHLEGPWARAAPVRAAGAPLRPPAAP